MELKAGDQVVAESESTERSPRFGVVKEVLGPASSSRYRIRWEDEHESIYTPAAGALHRVGEGSRKAGARS